METASSTLAPQRRRQRVYLNAPQAAHRGKGSLQSGKHSSPSTLRPARYWPISTKATALRSKRRSAARAAFNVAVVAAYGPSAAA